LHTQFLRCRQIERKPPILLMCSKRFACGEYEIVAMENRMKAIASLGPLLDESLAMSDQGTQFSHLVRWNPHCGDEVGRK
jgi:hypothetical protein